MTEVGPLDAGQFDLVVFDLDGTLTVPNHDFAALRQTLGLEPKQDILAGIAERSPERRAADMAYIRAWEVEIAEQSERARGALALLERLAAAGIKRAILTRNRRDVALRTLEIIGLAHFFPADAVWGRASCEPKPSPAGVEGLCALLAASPARTCMVGDHVMDVAAGEAAGATGVLVHPDPSASALLTVTHHVHGLDEL